MRLRCLVQMLLGMSLVSGGYAERVPDTRSLRPVKVGRDHGGRTTPTMRLMDTKARMVPGQARARVSAADIDIDVDVGVANLTRGIRFEGNLSAIAQAPSDPTRLYLGTSRGRVHVSRDGGLSWEETSIHTYKQTFVGALRGFEVPKNSLTRPLGITPLSSIRMNRFYLPSRLFNPEFTTGTDARPSSDFLFDDSSDLSRATFGLSPGRVRDPVQGLLRSTYASQTTPDTLGFEDSGTGGGNDLAVGIRARAPWLAYQVRRR
ncbi:MAG: hypothetical protein ACPGQS_09815, partial [Bradymonadia bacterium]